MATRKEIVDYICDQAQIGSRVTSRKMFGEYAL